MNLYKIITRGGKKHFYESERSYIIGLRYHKKYLNTVRSYLGYMTIECYQIDVMNVLPNDHYDHDVYWKQIDGYHVDGLQLVREHY